MTDRIVIRRDELFDGKVDEALERERELRKRLHPEALPPVSPLRALVMSSTFHLPLAGAIAAFFVWFFLEPSLMDGELAAGPVTLVNRDPFEASHADGDGAVRNLTIGRREVIVLERHTHLEPGAGGQPAFASFDDIHEGDLVEAISPIDGEDNRFVAVALRPTDQAHADEIAARGQGRSVLVFLVLFPLTAIAVATALYLAEGITSGNFLRMTERALLGLLLVTVFSVVAYIPAGAVLTFGHAVVGSQEGFVNPHNMTPVRFVVFTACRGAAWAAIGAGLGLGMNLVRSTQAQLRNSVVGGALGGALGGAFFDPIGRFLTPDSFFIEASLSRAIGLVAVGACVGFFVALVDRLAREAWICVRTGPLAGKQFVLWKTPTTIGSSPRCDVYLFKDVEIDAEHVSIHRVGNRYEVEDLGSRAGTTVSGRAVRRHRLSSGDQIVVGSTVIDFEERARRGEGGREAT